MVDFGASGTALTVSTNPSTVNAIEGTTVVSDTAGELLFYSNGQTVWNRNHQVMVNGSGLIAAPSATQTVAAFPSLSRPGFYFVVSNGGAYETGGIGPLRYSEVDMTLDGGLGGVTSVKNVLLDGGANTATEGMVAVPNSDGTGFWVITATASGSAPDNTNLVAHEFDGVGPTGTIVRSPMSTANSTGFGSFNLSQDLTRIVQLSGNRNQRDAAQIRLLQLNAETGQVAELVTWATPSGSGTGDYGYSADFSPDGRWVYVTRIFSGGKLFRYDIQNNDTAVDLQAAVETVGSIGTNGGQVKRAPDGRMYVADYNATSISVINDPNSATDPGYSQASLALTSGSRGQFGLPQTATGCPIPLTAPSSLAVTSAGYDRMALTWSAPVADDGTLLGYRIERSTDGALWELVVANTATTGRTYLDVGLEPGTEYSYRVFAVYSAVTSQSSNVDSGTTGDEAPPCGADHVDCAASPLTGHDVVLEVDASCDIQTAGLALESDLAVSDPAPFSYPLGVLNFSLDCGTVGYTTVVTQYYFDEGDRDYLLRKYNPATGAFFTVADYDLEETTVNGRRALRVSFEITDGGALDMDGLLNGIIVDPVGLARADVGAPNTGVRPGVPPPALAASALTGAGLLAAAGFVLLRRRYR